MPPLWIQLAQLEWPAAIAEHLRYIANTGGRMPLRNARRAAPARCRRPSRILMYGLTEAFRSTYLPPEEVDRRPDSIGKAIPNAEILVLREDGTPCAPDEPGELVHRGALVAHGLLERCGKDRRALQAAAGCVGGREAGLVLPEIAVFSGDTVRKDEEGFLYFIGRRDEMIKTSGYRVSPTEVEEVVYATKLVGEVAAFGVAASVARAGDRVSVTAAADASDRRRSIARRVPATLPAYMVPADIDVRCGPLPRNPERQDRPQDAGAAVPKSGAQRQP